MKFRRSFNKKDSCFTFELYNPKSQFFIWAVTWEEASGYLSVNASETLAREVFGGLLFPDEVRKAFGKISLPKGCVVVDSNKIKPSRLDKKAVIRLTAVVKGWWHKGLENCHQLIAKKKLDGWMEKHHVLWDDGKPCL